MATAPALTVIMSVYNGEGYLRPCVESILRQDFADFEFLVLNDGSTDDSSKILRDFAVVDQRIRLIERENRGLVASLNELIDKARAPLLARMDSDDICLPDRFAKQVAYLGQHTNVDVLGSNTLDIDESGEFIGTTEDYPLDPVAARAALKDGPPVCHPSVMMRSAFVRKLGGYRPAFRHAEDYDLWLRASLHGEIANLPDRLLLYRRSPDQISQKHAAAQAKAAAIAWLDHVRCCEGKPSLFDHATDLSEIDDLDALFGDVGAGTFVRRKVVERMRYSSEMLEGPGFGLMMQQVRQGDGFDGAGRTVLRLGRKGRIMRSALLALSLVGMLLSSS